jgi:hypothetical protein
MDRRARMRRINAEVAAKWAAFLIGTAFLAYVAFIFIKSLGGN